MWICTTMPRTFLCDLTRPFLEPPQHKVRECAEGRQAV